MLIPLRTDCPLKSTPYMNWALIAANFAMFFVELYFNPSAPDQSWFTRMLILNPSHPRIWQYITSAFLHAGWLHIIGNMLFLMIFGANVNDRLGHLGYLGFYLAGAVFAGIGYVLIDGQADVLGASGAVAAVTGAYLILLPRSHITIFYFFFFIGTAEIAALLVILFFFSMDVWGQFVLRGLLGNNDGVAHAEHISGTLFGAVTCLVCLLVGLLPRDQFDVLAMAQRWNRRRQYRDMVSKGYNPFGVSTPPPGRSARQAAEPPDPRTQQIMELRVRISDAVAGHDLAMAARLYLDLMNIAPEQVISRTALLDIANYFASQQMYEPAAGAYEQFQKYYGNYEQIEQVQLMMGVIYARYLHRPDLARQYLLRAMARLHAQRDLELARSELAQLDAAASPGNSSTKQE